MQRVWAILLLVLFSFPLIEPAFFAETGSNLPKCCRGDGAHHCTMARKAPAGASIGGVREKCPYFPAAQAIPAHGTIIFLSQARAFAASLASHRTAPAQTEARYRVCFTRAWQKRGPPPRLA